MSLISNVQEFAKKNKILTISLGVSTLLAGIAAYRHFVVNSVANIARRVPVERITKVIEVLLKDHYFDLNV